MGRLQDVANLSGRSLTQSIAKGSTEPDERVGISRGVARIGPLLVLLGAFVLEVFRLGHTSVRGDEAFTFFLARNDLPSIIATLRATEPHPPGYYLSVHYWMRLAGDTEFALRFLSVVALLPLVALGYRLVCDQTGSAGRAITVAAVVAVNPFLIWHGQDARMYTALAVFPIVAAIATLRLQMLMPTSVARIWGLNGIAAGAMLLALLIHYAAVFFGFGLAAVALATLRGRKLTAWLVGQAVIAVIYGFWLVWAIPLLSTHTKSWISPATPFEVAYRTIVAFGAGPAIEPSLAPWLALPFALALVLGAVQLVRGKSWTLVALLVLPLVAISAVSVYRPMFDERYVVYGAPIAAAIVGLGLTASRGRVAIGGSLLLAGLVGVAALASLRAYYFDPSLSKSPNWRALGTTVITEGRIGDLFVVTYPDPSPLYYVRDRMPSIVLPESAPIDSVATISRLEGLDADRIWLVPIRAPNWDPDGFVEHWLDIRWQLEREIRPDRASPLLKLYRSPAAALQQGRTLAQPTVFDGKIALAGWSVKPTEPARRGGSLELSLFFEAVGPIDRSYKIFNHLIGPDGNLYGQADGIPAESTYPTNQWRSSEIVLDRFTIPIATDGPAGRYQIRTGIYEPDSGKRLAVRDQSGRVIGDSIELGPIDIRE